MRVPFLLAMALGSFLAGWACAAAGPDGTDNLYEVSAIVTGQRPETRDPAIRQSLLDVLVKVSGDPRLFDDPGEAALAGQATTFVDHYRYHDRLEGKPIHDEQGTRDRPHDLIIDFNPPKVDAALHSLGRDPWTAPRPRIAVFLAVQQGPSTYVTSADGERSYGQPDAFRAASDKTGVPVSIPSEANLASAGLAFETLRGAYPAALERPAAAIGAEVPLVGTMVFSEDKLGWVVDWHLARNGKAYHWTVSGVSYDEAFRNGLRGAAQILSGHGQPD